MDEVRGLFEGYRLVFMLDPYLARRLEAITGRDVVVSSRRTTKPGLWGDVIARAVVRECPTG